MRSVCFYFICFLLASILLAGCNEDDVSLENSDVFISGQDDQQAVYWKNGEINYLAEDSEFSYTARSAIVYSESDIYIGGGIKDQVLVAAYWKNGEITILSDKYSQTYSIATAGSDVYIAGFEMAGNNLNARLWTNGGNRVELMGLDDNYISSCTDVAVLGSDIHVIGLENIDNIVSAKYWKNGVLIDIIPDSPKYSEFTDIAVSENDVHIVGYTIDENNIRTYKYWRNGTEEKLPSNVAPRFIELSGSDVYLLDGNARYYSKNDVEFKLKQVSTFDDFSTTGLVIVNDNVYVSAIRLGPNNERLGGYLWKNGEVQTSLTVQQEGVEFTGVVVVKN